VDEPLELADLVGADPGEGRNAVEDVDPVRLLDREGGPLGVEEVP
jgi:hypothetical protein